MCFDYLEIKNNKNKVFYDNIPQTTFLISLTR